MQWRDDTTLPTAALRDFSPVYVRFGSWLCENSSARSTASDRHPPDAHGMSASLRYCCKSIFGIWSRNIDSRSGKNEQQRFKTIDAPIRLLQISISQSLLGDFCNSILQKRTARLRLRGWLGLHPLGVADQNQEPLRRPLVSSASATEGCVNCKLPKRSLIGCPVRLSSARGTKKPRQAGPPAGGASFKIRWGPTPQRSDDRIGRHIEV